jgi:hypothetical protein
MCGNTKCVRGQLKICFGRVCTERDKQPLILIKMIPKQNVIFMLSLWGAFYLDMVFNHAGSNGVVFISIRNRFRGVSGYFSESS